MAFGPDGRVLAVLTENEGTIELRDSATGELLATMWSLARPDEGRAWVTWTPEGYYDCSEGAEQYIRFRDEQGAIHSAADYAHVLHDPEHLRAALGR
jgi:hypothetical protein